jgi:hypothetical protein
MSQSSPESIKYSAQSILWIYGDSTEANLANLSQITTWWTGLDGKNVKKRYITTIQIYLNCSIFELDSIGEFSLIRKWQPIHEDIIEFKIQNPQIIQDNLSFNGETTEKIAYLDFDPTQNQLVVNLAGVYKIENPYTEPKKVYSTSPRKYVFTLQEI